MDTRRRVVRPASAPAHTEFLLAEHFGNQPGLLLDAHGVIVAANDQAMALLGRAKAELCGTPFGLWASQLSQVDLDVVKNVGGVKWTTVVRATRTEAGPHSHVPVVLEELDEAAATGLADAVFTGLIEAGEALEGWMGPASVGPLPDMMVRPQCREAVKAAVEFGVKMAAIQNARLNVAPRRRGDGWIEIHISFELSQGAPSEGLGEPELPEFRTEDDMRCGLVIDYPRLEVVLRVPCAQQHQAKARAAAACC